VQKRRNPSRKKEVRRILPTEDASPIEFVKRRSLVGSVRRLPALLERRASQARRCSRSGVRLFSYGRKRSRGSCIRKGEMREKFQEKRSGGERSFAGESLLPERRRVLQRGSLEGAVGRIVLEKKEEERCVPASESAAVVATTAFPRYRKLQSRAASRAKILHVYYD